LLPDPSQTIVFVDIFIWPAWHGFCSSEGHQGRIIMSKSPFKRLAIFALLLGVTALVGYGVYHHSLRGKIDGLVLGAALPLTGQYAQYGVVPRNAIQLAIKQRKAAGYPYNVSVQYEDTQLRPNLALTAIRKLIDVHGVPVVFGAAGSNETEVIGPIAQQNKVVLISPSSTAANLSKIGDFFFRTIASDVQEGQFMARFVFGQGVKNVAIFAVNDTGTKSLADSFRDEFVKLGGTVSGYVLAPKDANDLRTQITSLRSASAAAVFAVGYAAETGIFLRQAKELTLGVPVYSAHPAEAPEVRKIAGDAAEGLIFSTPARADASGVGAKFSAAYRAEYGQDPGEFAPEAYDAAMLILDAIHAAGPNPTSIRDYLRKVRGYDGASGLITFSGTGDVEKPINIMIIKDGKVVPFGR
jgi:branched-chain amino acid transport system substrate-binding protein